MRVWGPLLSCCSRRSATPPAQSVLRLKEAGLTSAIITRKDIQDAAGSVDAVIAARTAAGGIKESWISPGEE